MTLQPAQDRQGSCCHRAVLAHGPVEEWERKAESLGCLKSIQWALGGSPEGQDGQNPRTRRRTTGRWLEVTLPHSGREPSFVLFLPQ